MNKHAPPARWYTPWRAVAGPQDDPADLGTAFGLDLSMAPPELPTTAATRTLASRSAWVSGWKARWALRGRNAA